MPKLKLSSKILIYFLVVSLIPLVVANFILVSSANSQLLEAASTKQQAIATYLSDRVGSYLDGNIEDLAYLAQAYSTGSSSPENVNENLALLLHQNADLQKVSILNADGVEEAVFDRSGFVADKKDLSDTAAFKAVNFLAGKSYIGSVNYTDPDNPTITIAVPILTANYHQRLNNLSEADFGTYRSADDIKGALVAEYRINDLWQTILSTRIGQGGYAYVVDSLGNLVAHPDTSFFTQTPKLADVEATKQFIDGNFDTNETVSETGINVISTPRLIPNSGWAVIVEEPVASIYSGINSYIRLAATIGLSAIAFSIGISIFFSRQLIDPIRKLSRGAKKFGAGDFGGTIDIKSNDEFQDLADTFNKMGSSIQELVSDLKTYNVNLLLEQTKLSNIIESVSDGVVALNKAGEIVTINPPAASLVGKKPFDIRGKKFTDVYLLEQNNQRVSVELHKPGLYHYSDLTLPQKDKIAYLDLVISTILSKDSDISAIITIHDLTKSRELDFMKLDFVAIAAHELRTPLTVLRGYLEMLNTNAQQQLSVLNIESLQKAIIGANQLRDLISKLLNIARIERGEMEIFTEKIDLAHLVKENIHQHETIAGQNEQYLKYESNVERAVMVPADPSSIVEVLNNLIGNALKYAGSGKTVIVRLLVQKEIVRVEISDNGPGIPTDRLDKLFTKFYRAQRTMTAGTRGTGLGLFVTKTIIELQGGEVGVESTVGKGTTFHFTLPVYVPEKHDKLVSKQKKPGGVHGWFKKRTHS